MPQRPSRRVRRAASGDLTPAQHEIMRLVWEAGAAGLTGSEIWQAIAAGRDVTRTTVLNLVDRLEKRGWLERRAGAEGLRYAAAVDRSTTDSRLAGDFVTGFFGGSVTSLVQSLLGSRRVTAAELEEMRDILARATLDRACERKKETGS